KRPRLKPFKLVRGPAAVLRYSGASVGAQDGRSGQYLAATFRITGPELGRMTANWDGYLDLEAQSPGASNLAQELARAGLLVEETVEGRSIKVSAGLIVGDAHFRFATLSHSTDDKVSKIRLSLYADTKPQLAEVSVLAAANRKLQDATADTPIALVIRLARMNPERQNPPATIKLEPRDVLSLEPGPPA